MKQKTDSKLGKEYVKVVHVYIYRHVQPCVYKYIDMYRWNTGLDEAQAEIKIAGRNINNLIYKDMYNLVYICVHIYKCICI